MAQSSTPPAQPSGKPLDWKKIGLSVVGAILILGLCIGALYGGNILRKNLFVPEATTITIAETQTVASEVTNGAATAEAQGVTAAGTPAESTATPATCAAQPTDYPDLTDASGNPFLYTMEWIWSADVKFVHREVHMPDGPTVSVVVFEQGSANQLGRFENLVKTQAGGGAMWEYPVKGCEGLDQKTFLKEIEDHIARRRAISTGLHSGGIIVLDEWVKGDWTKPSSMKWLQKPVTPQSEWNKLAPSLVSTPVQTVDLQSVTGATPIPSAVQAGCPGAKFSQHTTADTFTVNGPAVVQPYQDGQQVRVMLKAGESAQFQSVKGDVYEYVNNAACNANLEAEFAKGTGYEAKTIAQLREMGWVK